MKCKKLNGNWIAFMVYKGDLYLSQDPDLAEAIRCCVSMAEGV